jgi:hypothetical protein
MRFALALACLMSLANGCSKSTGMKAAPADAAPDAIASNDLAPANGNTDAALDAFASSDLAPAKGNTDANLGCGVPLDYPLPAPVTCSSTVLNCDTSWDNCLSTSAGQTIGRLAQQQCGMGCGSMMVGFVAGCAAEVREVLPNRPNTDLATCLSNAILGQRWACTPENGWVWVYLGSCTLA